MLNFNISKVAYYRGKKEHLSEPCTRPSCPPILGLKSSRELALDTVFVPMMSNRHALRLVLFPIAKQLIL